MNRDSPRNWTARIQGGTPATFFNPTSMALRDARAEARFVKLTAAMMRMNAAMRMKRRTSLMSPAGSGFPWRRGMVRMSKISGSAKKSRSSVNVLSPAESERAPEQGHSSKRMFFALRVRPSARSSLASERL